MLKGSWSSSHPSRFNYLIEERSHIVTHEGPGTYTRRNELWRIETDVISGEVSECLMVNNEARLMYEPFLPAESNKSAAEG